MSDDRVYCCNKEATCNNYERSELVFFEQVKFDKGFVWEKWKTSGICWIFLLSGEAGVSIEDEVVFVEAGEMFLLPALKGKLKAFTPLEFLYFISDRPTEYCLKTVSELGCLEGRGELLEILPLNQLLKGFVEMLTVYLEDGVDCRYLFEEKQEELFVLMKSCYSKEQLSYFFYTLSLHKEGDLKKLIEDNCLHVKSVAELAQICGYSVSSFKRAFKEIFDEPIYQWILGKKADRLKERLSGEEVNLKEIIYEFGFSSPAHFTKFCKKWLGMTPTKFIEEQKMTGEHIDL